MAQFEQINPDAPKIPWIYHIIHIDRLKAILNDGFLYSDAQMNARAAHGTKIGIAKIKARRLNKPIPDSHLTVGQCVPFYFCNRSPMLYVISRAAHSELSYRGGQAPIIHLVFDPSKVATWAEREKLQYFVTNTTAACNHFTASRDLMSINRLSWKAITSNHWRDFQSEKSAEFLVEQRVDISCLRAIGTYDESYAEEVRKILQPFESVRNVVVKSMRMWYY